ncbi:MAG: hypothetical protein ACREQL_16450 [Candidatus Binatia bacterium]
MSTRKAAVRIGLALLLALDTRLAGALTPFTEVTGGGFSAVTTGAIPGSYQPSFLTPNIVGTLSVTIEHNADGSTTGTLRGGRVDVVHFGPGLSQFFIGSAGMSGFAVARMRSLHAFVATSAMSEPPSYSAPFPGALGDNPFNAIGFASVVATFHDVLTPPPTQAAPNPGTTTMLTVIVHADCDRSPGIPDFAMGQNMGAYLALSANLYFLDGSYVGGVQARSHDSPSNSYPCPLERGAIIGVPVLTPIELRVDLGVTAGGISGKAYASKKSSGFVDALNTGTVSVVNEDGVGLVGQSMHDYTTFATPPAIETTTTSTTTTTFTPPTTLASCTGYCSDAVHQPDCGESCECPMTGVDQVGTVCDSATATPAIQPSCARCAGCQVDLSSCVSTTTTLPPCAGSCANGVVQPECGEDCDCVDDHFCAGGAIVPPQPACGVCNNCALIGCGTSTTTTTAPGATTTTTVPAACVGLAGIPRAVCLLDAAIAAPLCGTETLPPKVDKGVRSRLGGARTQLANADGQSGKPLAKRLKRARRALAAAVTRASKAAAAKSTQKRISTDCAGSIATIADRVMAELPAS